MSVQQIIKQSLLCLIHSERCEGDLVDMSGNAVAALTFAPDGCMCVQHLPGQNGMM